MPENPWYPFYIGDYQQKTSHLTLIEHGAYFLLLNHYYATHHALPGNRKIIYRICRAADRNERRAIDRVLDQFFTVFNTEIEPNPDRLWITTVASSGIFFVHRKCEFEIGKQLNYSKSQSANAKIRHSKRHMPNTMPDSCQTDARARVPQPQPQSESKKENSRGTRFALQDPPADWIQFCITQRPDLDPGMTFDSFRDYWQSKPGKDALKLDWLKTWRNWVRNQKSTPKGQNHDQRSKYDLTAQRIAQKYADDEQRKQAVNLELLEERLADTE